MYRLRFFRVLFQRFFNPGSESSVEDSLISFRASFWDVDLTRFYTHSYLAFMALARWKWVLKHWRFRKALKNGWSPVTSAEIIRYRKPIRIFQKFTVRTRLIYWTEKAVYFEQVFETNEGIAAIGFVKGLIVGKKSNPKSWEAFNIPETPPTEIPDVVKHWEEMSADFKKN